MVAVPIEEEEFYGIAGFNRCNFKNLCNLAQ